MEVKVVEVFNTTNGCIAVLDFPKGVKPVVNMGLKREEKALYVKEISFSQPGGFNSLDDTKYACLLSTTVVAGDVLEIV